MNSDVKQFQLKRLFFWTTSIAIAIQATNSLSLFALFGLLFCVANAILELRRNRSPLAVASIAGAIWGTIAPFYLTFFVVVTGHREHGVLYDEDGPYVFFLKMSLMFVLFAASGTIVGWCVGKLVQLLADTIKFRRVEVG